MRSCEVDHHNAAETRKYPVHPLRNVGYRIRSPARHRSLTRQGPAKYVFLRADEIPRLEVLGRHPNPILPATEGTGP